MTSEAANYQLCLELITRITREMNKTHDPQELANRLVTEIRERLGCLHVSLQCTGLAQERRVFDSFVALAGSADRATYDSAVEVHEALPFKGRAKGTLSLSWVGEKHPLGRERNLLQALAHQTAVALQSSVRYAERESRAEMLEKLIKITTSIVGYLNVEEAVNAVMRFAAAGLDSKGAAIWLLEPESAEWCLRYGHNIPSTIGWRLPIEKMGPSAEQLLLGKAFITEDFGTWVQETPGILDEYAGDKTEYLNYWASSRMTLLGVPLWDHGRVSGVLVTYREGDAGAYGQPDVDFLLLFGDAASVVLSNARLHSALVTLSAELESRVESRTRDLFEAMERARDAHAATIRVQEEERTRIADDLHDGSCQLIAGALFQLEAGKQDLQRVDCGAAQQKFEAVERLLKGLDLENRRLIEGIHPSALHRKGLRAAISRELSAHQEQKGGSWELQVSGDFHGRLAPQKELAVYRIAQEALHNAARHADATSVCVLISYEPDVFRMSINDNGKGFDPESVRQGVLPRMGLISLQDRAESIGGRLKLESQPFHGTHLEFVLPLSSVDSVPGGERC